MRQILIKIFESNIIFKKIALNGLKVWALVIPLEKRLKLRFKRTLGYELNLKNPKTFNEKIQWLKVNDRTPLHTVCADKYAVRKYVKEKIGGKYLVPLVLRTTNVNDLTPEILADYPVIIKTNHDSGGGTIVKSQKEINWSEIRRHFKRRLSFNYDYGKGEWQYKNIPPCVIVEKLLIDEEGNIPADYKMHCFNGKLVFTQVDLDRSTDHKRNLYDIDWNFINCVWFYENGRTVEKPEVYGKMKIIAEEFAKDFIYVRVDLYIINKEIYFGELTFHSDSGNGIFRPKEWDIKFGEMLSIPI